MAGCAIAAAMRSKQLAGDDQGLVDHSCEDVMRAVNTDPNVQWYSQ